MVLSALQNYIIHSAKPGRNPPGYHFLGFNPKLYFADMVVAGQAYIFEEIFEDQVPGLKFGGLAKPRRDPTGYQFPDLDLKT